MYSVNNFSSKYNLSYNRYRTFSSCMSCASLRYGSAFCLSASCLIALCVIALSFLRYGHRYATLRHAFLRDAYSRYAPALCLFALWLFTLWLFALCLCVMPLSLMAICRIDLLPFSFGLMHGLMHSYLDDFILNTDHWSLVTAIPLYVPSPPIKLNHMTISDALTIAPIVYEPT